MVAGLNNAKKMKATTMNGQGDLAYTVNRFLVQVFLLVVAVSITFLISRLYGGLPRERFAQLIIAVMIAFTIFEVMRALSQ